MRYQAAKENILAHTSAKLSMYENYLRIYLSILLNTDFTINIVDLFCGKGLYKNGKKGSALIAYDCIKDIIYSKKTLNNFVSNQKIRLILNDVKTRRIENVKHILEAQNNSEKICIIEYYNKKYLDIINLILNKNNKLSNLSNRNLFFIDPYGYKDIFKEHLYKLISMSNSELLIFLPVSFIYRFIKIAFEDFENPKYKKTRDFMNDFFDNPKDRIYKYKSVFDFIKDLCTAFTFLGDNYCCSYYIRRNKVNVYALFFLTSNIKGFEKILETQWKCDLIEGKGFSDSEVIIPLIAEYNYKQKNKEFEIKLKEYIRSLKTNIELYKFSLFNYFLPKHTNNILKSLQKNQTINVFDMEMGKEARKGSFYLNYDNYKNNRERVRIVLKK